MFELNEDTRNSIVEILRNQFSLPVEEYSDEEINAVINEVVDTVKRQFGF